MLLGPAVGSALLRLSIAALSDTHCSVSAAVNNRSGAEPSLCHPDVIVYLQLHSIVEVVKNDIGSDLFVTCM